MEIDFDESMYKNDKKGHLIALLVVLIVIVGVYTSKLYMKKPEPANDFSRSSTSVAIPSPSDEVERELERQRKNISLVVDYLKKEEYGVLNNICKVLSLAKRYEVDQVRNSTVACKVKLTDGRTIIEITPLTSMKAILGMAIDTGVKDNEYFQTNYMKLKYYRQWINSFEKYLLKISAIYTKRKMAKILGKKDLAKLEKESNRFLRELDKEFSKVNLDSM